LIFLETILFLTSEYLQDNEGRKLGYEVGYDKGHTDGHTDAQANKSMFNKHRLQGFREGLAIRFRNDNQTTIVKMTTQATQTSASTKRVENTSQTVAMDHQQPERVQQVMQTATSIKNASSDTHDMSTAPATFQQQPQATSTATAPNASANGPRNAEEDEEERGR
jgi:hypothetical protein